MIKQTSVDLYIMVYLYCFLGLSIFVSRSIEKPLKQCTYTTALKISSYFYNINVLVY